LWFYTYEVEANERAGKEYPLQGRCLKAADWNQSHILESLLVHPHEASVEMQHHEGMGLDTVFVLMTLLHALLTAKSVQVTLFANYPIIYV